MGFARGLSARAVYHRRMPGRPLATALALALSAASPLASATPPPRCTIPDAEDWREYRSAHFVLATDVSRGRAADLVLELERLHALVVAALFGDGVEIPGRVHAVAFASPRRFEAFAPEHAAGYVISREWDTTLVFPFERLDPASEVIAHELAHRVAFHHFPRQTAWFREGLARFVATVGEVRRDERAARLGSHIVRGDRRSGGRWAGLASPTVLAEVKHATSVGAKELLEWRGAPDDADPGRFHAASWLLYHWLWNHRSQPFTEYQRRLAEGDDPAAAWRAAFPEYDPANAEAMARLDAELASYRREARFVPYQVRVGAVDGSFEDSPIPPADLHMLLLRIRGGRRWRSSPAERDALVRAEIAEALREDPHQPEALAARARDAGESAAGALRAATLARPKDPRAWLELSNALDANDDAAEREGALRKAVALAPDDARANNALAWLLVTSGRAKEARPFAERALDLAPWSPATTDTLAAVAFGIGQCKPALALQRRAADRFPAGSAVHVRLAEYEAKCGGAEPGTAR